MTARGPEARALPSRLARFDPPAAWDPRFLEGTDEIAPLARAAERFREFDRWPTVAEIDERLRDLAGIRFAEQPPKKKRRRRRNAPIGAEALYDGKITLEGAVPTRASSWHDLMNALVWASFPRAKRAISARQYAALQRRIGEPRRRLPGARTREEDALTMLDEGGELWLSAGVERDLGAIDLDAASLEAAAARGTVSRIVFGHALLEHAIAGCRDARPRRLVLPIGAGLPSDPDALRAVTDAALAGWLEAGGS